jgi:glycosyltransferase involved in cell wall biosynthesis
MAQACRERRVYEMDGKIRMKKKVKFNVVLTDFAPNKDWPFFKGLSSDADWIVETCVNNGKQSNFLLQTKRYFVYFFFSFNRFLKRKKYENIVAWQQFYGIFICYFLWLFRSKAKLNVFILTFIYKEKKGLIGRLYKRFILHAISCRQLMKIGVLSSYEINYYHEKLGISKDKFFFHNIGFDEQRQFPITKSDYFLAPGRSNRDYDFLVSVFKKLPNEKLYIVSDCYKNKKLPINVKILNSCFGTDYEKMLASCFAVLIPLGNNPISSGQLVANKAMLYKKPIIATNNPGIVDYVKDGLNGFISDKDISAFCDKIYLLKNNSCYKEIQDNCIPFSEYEYGKAVSSVVFTSQNR